MEADGLEAALNQFEREAAGTVRSLTQALRDAKKLQAAAAQGQLARSAHRDREHDQACWPGLGRRSGPAVCVDV